MEVKNEVRTIRDFKLIWTLLLLRGKMYEYFMPIFLLAWLLESKSHNFMSCYVFSCKIFSSNYVHIAHSIVPFVQIEISLQVTTCYRIWSDLHRSSANIQWWGKKSVLKAGQSLTNTIHYDTSLEGKAWQWPVTDLDCLPYPGLSGKKPSVADQQCPMHFNKAIG